MQKLDKLKWALALVLFLVGLIANYYYVAFPLPLRIAAWVILVCLMVVILLQTAKGRQFWLFAKEARNELYRVVWPTRKETVQTTLIVFVMVAVLALILWGVDSLFIGLMSWFTGRGG